MILEGEFFSGGHLRWNLGWPTPNYAGAFIVTLVVLCWSVGASRWRWAALAAETGGLFLLAKTYSRGAVVAWGLAWLFGVLASCGWRVPTERLVWTGRVVILAVMMLAVGFGWSRATESGDEIRGSPASAVAKLRRDKSDGPIGERTAKVENDRAAPAAEDGSVVNRLALWRGGLQMIAAAPWSGWGAGESGRSYMNWFQDTDQTEGYTTMVNSHLHVAVEHGLPVLAAVLWVGAWLLVVAWRGAWDEGRSGESVLGATRSTLMMAAGASLVAWMAANVFTTLWIEPKLWIVPGLAALIVLAGAVQPAAPGWRRALPAGLAGAVVVALGLWLAGRTLAAQSPLAIRPTASGAIIIGPRGGPVDEKAAWHVWADPAVLGPTPGKELRRWLASSPEPLVLIVHRPDSPTQPENLAGATGVILVGRQVERLAQGGGFRHPRLRLVHPLRAPPPDAVRPADGSCVVLPGIDEAGNGLAWRTWAAAVGTRVIESPATGLDIRAAWPAVALLTDDP